MKFGLDREEYELFVRDAMLNSVIVGGACSNNCVFCSCKAQHSAGKKNWINYISKEDLLSIVDYINPNKKIFFGEGPSFLSCEPFQHPNYIELLKLLNTFFKDTKKITTTVGKNIKPEWYDAFKECKVSFVVSVNTFNKKNRKSLMKSEDDFDGLINFLRECPDNILKISFLYTGDVDDLRKDLDYLYSINDKYIDKITMLRLCDYSKFHNKETKNLYHYSKKTWNEAVITFNETVHRPEYWIRSLTDFPLEIEEKKTTFPIYNIHASRRDFIEKIKDTIKFVNDKFYDISNCAFLLPESSYYLFKEKFPNLEGILVKNNLFGGSYISAGLLTKNDIINAVLKEKPYKTYITSRLVFNEYYRDLLGNHAKYDYPFDLILI